ncbi:hypothetical protein I4F81_012880 [Pyropia yezoensis]|uniref:Uncharacterized protein n=1 Tax=Pyropia yezoensis TaxID=2788 RepID=A0ACC3CJK5_PYRYE|nr:hypothetical protein I4F81_012880 [Neopyropia yezoensis]
MKRSLWCPRVQMAAIKPAFDVPELAARRLKLSDVDDVTVVENISVFTNKSISEVIAALLALCALEPSMPRTIAQTLEESFDARPARHVALVLSGLDVNSHTQATAKRASRLAVRRAARTKESNAQKNSPTGVRAASGARKRRAVAAPSAQSVGKKPNKGATPGAA